MGCQNCGSPSKYGPKYLEHPEKKHDFASEITMFKIWGRYFGKFQNCLDVVGTSASLSPEKGSRFRVENRATGLGV